MPRTLVSHIPQEDKRRQVLVQGLPAGPVLENPLRLTLTPQNGMSDHQEGIYLSRKLAELLRVGPGDIMEAELRRGTRRTVILTVAGVVDILGDSDLRRREPPAQFPRGGVACIWSGGAVLTYATTRADGAESFRRPLVFSPRIVTQATAMTLLFLVASHALLGLLVRRLPGLDVPKIWE